MIHPRVLFVGDPGAATPWVGIAKKLARACYDLKIASKLYKLGSGVTIRVENIFPLGGTLAGISKVWIEAGTEIFTNFLVYPRDNSYPLGFYQESPLAFRHPQSASEIVTLPLNNAYYNLAKLAVSTEHVNVVTDSVYELCGNQFYFRRVYNEDTGKFVIVDKTIYSWHGSYRGDGPINVTDSAGKYYLARYASSTVAYLQYLDANGDIRIPLKSIYRNSQVFKYFTDSSLVDSYINGFAIKELTYTDEYDNNYTILIYLVAFTFLRGTKIYDTEIHIYDNSWTEITSISLFNYSGLGISLLYPVRFNHDTSECVVIYNYVNTSPDGNAVFTDLVRCGLSYEVDEEGTVTVISDISTSTTTTLGPDFSAPTPTTETTIVGDLSSGRTTTYTYNYDTQSVYDISQTPIGANYTEENVLSVAYFSDTEIEEYLMDYTSVTYDKSGSTTIQTIDRTGTKRQSIRRTKTITAFGISLVSNYEQTFSVASEYNFSSTTTIALPLVLTDLITSCHTESTENIYSINIIDMMYLDLTLEFIITVESEREFTPTTLPEVNYEAQNYALYNNYPTPTTVYTTDDLTETGIDYQTTSYSTFKIYQQSSSPKILATYEQTETHNGSGESHRATGDIENIDTATQTRDVIVSYNIDCGISSNYSNAFQIALTGSYVTDFAYLTLSENISAVNYNINLEGVKPDQLIKPFGLWTYPNTWGGTIPAFASCLYSYFLLSVETRGPAYSEDYAEFSYCVDPRIKFTGKYPWLLSFYLNHIWSAVGPTAVQSYKPDEFIASACWTNGGYVQDMSEPGRFNEFLSESLLLAPIGLC